VCVGELDLTGYRKLGTGQENRTPAAEAGYSRVIYGTAEAVPFQETRSHAASKARHFLDYFRTTEVVP
jgi:hypothetical protein